MAFGLIVDVAIGLIFVYLLLGLIATASQELIAAWMKLRGKYLRNAIAELLSNGDASADIFQKVFGHGLVQATSQIKLPSYIPSRTFATVVIDSLGDGSQAPIFTQAERGILSLPPGPAKEALRVLLKNAAGDIDALQTEIATWYDEAMDRLSGKYKRWCQNYAAIFGVTLAILINANSLNIAYELWKNENLRANVTAAAQAYSDRNPMLQTLPAAGSEATEQAKAAKAALDENVSELFNLDLPIGWSPTEMAKLKDINGIIMAIIGWLITGAAVSLGAPFWFDLLKKALSVRAAGPKPARADGTKEK